MAININRKPIEVEVDDRKLSAVLDFESAIYYYEKMNESIFVGLEKILKKNDFVAFAYLIASVLRDEEDQLMGIEFVKKLDLIKYTDFFMGKLEELMENSLPEAKDSDLKKKK